MDRETEFDAPAPRDPGVNLAESHRGSRSERAREDAEELLSRRTVIKDRFLLEELLGVGGMGAVFKARDLRKVEAHDRDPWVAIKLLNEEFRKHPAALISLQREARKSQTLAHPNIIQVFDFDRDDDVVYMTMELLKGGDLNQLVRTHPDGLSPEQAYAIIDGIGEALQHAHDKQFVHADLTPKNVFLTSDGRVKVLDFGIAQAVGLAEAKAGAEDDTVFDPMSLGGLTRVYASKERLEGREALPADDVFGLGCLTYQLLSGAHPFKGHTVLEAETLGIRPQRPPGLSSRQWRALQKAMALPRADRYQSAKAFLDDFLPSAQGSKRVLFALVAGIAVLFAVFAYTEFAPPVDPVTQVEPGSDESAAQQQLLLAEALLRAERYDQSQSHIDRASALAPGNDQAAALQRRLDELRARQELSARARQARSRQIEQLLQDAERQIEAEHLVHPEGGSALDSYRAITSLDPDSERGALLLDRIVRLLRDRASLAVRNGDISMAERSLVELRRVASGDISLARLEADLEQLRRAESERLAAIDKLLTQARVLSGEGGATERRGLYLQVLQLDPVNAIAHQGIRQADDEIARVIRRIEKQALKEEQSLREAEALLASADALLGRKPGSVESFETAHSQLLQARQLSPGMPGIDARIDALHRQYRQAIADRIAGEEFAEADRLLLSAGVLDPGSLELAKLREALDALTEEEPMVPASF